MIQPKIKFSKNDDPPPIHPSLYPMAVMVVMVVMVVIVVMVVMVVVVVMK